MDVHAKGRMVVERGSVWWASLPEPLGSSPGYRRPVIVIQADDFTQSRLRTVIVIMVSTNLRLANAPGNVFLAAKLTGLPRDSVANVTQLYTVDKSLLTEEIATLPPGIMQRIDNGLRLSMAL
jgi:mRNA interferase MazF